MPIKEYHLRGNIATLAGFVTPIVSVSDTCRNIVLWPVFECSSK